MLIYSDSDMRGLKSSEKCNNCAKTHSIIIEQFFYVTLIYEQGLGITVFGMAYMFVHDGLVHRRFSVGPIANVPYFRRVAAAHKVIILIITFLSLFIYFLQNYYLLLLLLLGI